MTLSRKTRLARIALLGVAPSLVFSSGAAGQYASEVPKADVIDSREGTALAGSDAEESIPVAQEIDFVTDNTFRKEGGYDENLKRVARVDYYGTRYVDCEHYPLEIHTARPDRVVTVVKTGSSSKFESRKSGEKIVTRGESQGIPHEAERALLETFDFDTPIIDLEKKRPAIRPVGMQKLPGTLTWKFEVERVGDHYRVIYVDSHFGDVVKYTVMTKGGAALLDVALHDYRVVKGIRVPFSIDYRNADGTLLASDRLERVEVTRSRS